MFWLFKVSDDFGGHHSPDFSPVPTRISSEEFRSAFKTASSVSGHSTLKPSVSARQGSFCWSLQFWAERLLDEFDPHVSVQGDHSDHSVSKLSHFRISDRFRLALSQQYFPIHYFLYQIYLVLSLPFPLHRLNLVWIFLQAVPNWRQLDHSVHFDKSHFNIDVPDKISNVAPLFRSVTKPSLRVVNPPNKQ